MVLSSHKTAVLSRLRKNLFSFVAAGKKFMQVRYYCNSKKAV